MLLWMLFACETEDQVYEDFTSAVSTLEEVVEVPSQEEEEEELEIIINNTIYFKSVGIPCDEIGRRTLTFTEMFPGRAEIDSISAEFYSEAFRYNMSELEFEIPLDANGLAEANNCLIAMELPEVAENDGDAGIELEFKDIPLFGEAQDVFGVQWAFLFPAIYSKKQVSCDISDTPRAGNMINCEYVTSAGTTIAPARTVSDPELGENDFYEWGSTVLLVYIKGNVTGSFSDLGYEHGWNLVKLTQSELSLVEPINDLDELKTITIDKSKLAARDSIDVVGSTEDTSWPGMNFSIGIAPFRWFEYDSTATVESGYENVIPDINNSWIMDVYNVPGEEYFLSEIDSVGTYKAYYDQWNAYVPVAPFVPFLFDIEDDSIQDLDDSRIGAVCKNSYMLVFLYFQRPSKPSETLWYQLMGLKPGWYAYLGTHGDAHTWRSVLENTTIGVEYNYTNLVIGPSCQLPDEWQSWAGN